MAKSLNRLTRTSLEDLKKFVNAKILISDLRIMKKNVSAVYGPSLDQAIKLAKKEEQRFFNHINGNTT